ncbi:LysR family transcriptional regulator [Parapusillimonas granuli]|uniref:LysR family transcriptional regulator n=1 Tax=Parapusillimonas granuli TaxID=380911 RepID=A0A853FQ73_9BURK|nr:LysR family transcriptional regulator [Parapusillimonas granuli]MBB5216228.1 DNA-binding transcriptional LysR family regulator [Parapusillimonas granuli]MEB2400503.1 LysR family transcriptional regulator [Alcaligenaceae bacterium]NYT47905.1 LysR family transcriptional regulator [Parapusillimonas granuli]
MKEYLSPSVLTWLRCFDAAARHSNFTKAAAELHVTQGSVSQQVKKLEEWLDTPLFHRAARNLALTEEGARLADAVKQSFENLGLALADLRQRHRSHITSLSCSPSFALMWLTPRIGGLLRENPDLTLRVRGEFHSLDRYRMEQEQIQAAIRFDPGGYGDLRAVSFLDEWLIPVASPGFVAAHPEITDARRLPAALMLHDAMPWENAPEHVEWNTWLDGAGVPAPAAHTGLQFNLSQLALAAALSGQGVAMGRAALVLDDLKSGRLAQVFPQVVKSRASYQFVTPRQTTAPLIRIGDWLQAQGRLFRQSRDQWLEGKALKPAAARHGSRRGPG